ncbi:MAG: phosphoribosylglycinamide formyltransferase [Cognatishimia sp.]|uniref:phosphoribosylglycinamide formyltransferase n=1 Tax=Cognatishimia sp. 1_MG-2023 TaxID=3062642 RepID=UPI0026E23D43|nr:phosphoribosylglycinamide formyltransferase [Cognatishimia sp. 1_MG-2023]MDO6725335.1 phosphoribosylglycinamide formyltransferase [Cognatishimia sp. 1_MG-2023]
MKKRVAIFISGGGSNMVRLVEDMQSGDHMAEPVLVLANSADAGGLKKAEAMGVPTVAVDHRPFKGDRQAFESALQGELDKVSPDILCLAGFMRVLTESFVAPWEGRMLNIHPSLLPKYKGLHTHARALEAGDTEHGCSVHLVTPALDDGPILGQATVPVLEGDTPDDLAARVLVKEHLLYPAVLRRFAAGDNLPISL